MLSNTMLAFFCIAVSLFWPIPFADSTASGTTEDATVVSTSNEASDENFSSQNFVPLWVRGFGGHVGDNYSSQSPFGMTNSKSGNLLMDGLDSGDEEASDASSAMLLNAQLYDESSWTNDSSNSDIGTEQSCSSFEDLPRDPSDNVEAVLDPWSASTRPVCKLFVDFNDAVGSYVCTGVLVGPFHLLTARQCTYNPCSLNNRPTVTVYCGYGTTETGSSNLQHYGSASIGTCLRYEAFDDASFCENGTPFIGSRDFDIQLCSLDRRVGDTVGYFGFSSNVTDNTLINVLGYPRGGDLLAQFYPNAQEQLFYRSTQLSASTLYQLALEDAWIFDGESGGPYYTLGGNDDALSLNSVVAVHSGGPTGCTEFGTRINSFFYQDMRRLVGLPSTSTIDPWPSPPLHCQIQIYTVDIVNGFDGAVIGLAPFGTPLESNNVPADTLTVATGTVFQARVALYNVGNLDANVTVNFYASINAFIGDSDTLLDTVVIRPLSKYSRYRLARNIVASWGIGTQYIGVTWSTNQACFPPSPDGDTSYQVIGTVTTVEVVEGIPTSSPVTQISAIPSSVTLTQSAPPSAAPSTLEPTLSPTLPPCGLDACRFYQVLCLLRNLCLFQRI